MAEKPETKKDYVVTSPNTLKHEVGDTVSLTDTQARRLVNKIRLKDDVAAEASKSGRKSKLEAENKELLQRVSEVEAQNKALHSENAALKISQAAAR